MSPRVIVIGAGAAGSAAVRTLRGSHLVSVTVLDRTGQNAYNRTLVNKGVAIGKLTPEQIEQPGVEVTGDTVSRVDTELKTVQLSSGAQLRFDALILATGSLPRDWDANVPGSFVAAAGGRLTTLHSLGDAVRVRDLLQNLPGPGRVVILGAGLIAAETAALLQSAGHDITLVSRSATPGIAAFGTDLATRLTELHQQAYRTAFGRSVVAFDTTPDTIAVQLDDNSSLTADLVILAQGTVPYAPPPFGGVIEVDDHLRTSFPGIYAAGGVAQHHHPTLGPWRLDHWADAMAQGEHAARTVLTDLTGAADPGRYEPRSFFTATVYGGTVAAAGLLAAADATSTVLVGDPLLVVDEIDGTPVAVAGLNAVAEVVGWSTRLHTTESSQHP